MTNSIDTSKLSFVFEPGPHGHWADILGISTKLEGYVATQNAGSINQGIYYQVGGGGLNGRFATSLSGQLASINADLQTGYDQVYGEGSWKTDSSNPPNPPKLTSILTLLDPSVQSSDKKSGVSAMVYSVGPILDVNGITDEAQYKKIYAEAIMGISACNDYAATPNSGIQSISALRITMLSCGIYGDTVTDKEKLYHTAAKCIVEGLRDAVQHENNHSTRGITILINCNDGPGHGTERKAFSAVASELGLAVSQRGFDVKLT